MGLEEDYERLQKTEKAYSKGISEGTIRGLQKSKKRLGAKPKVNLKKFEELRKLDLTQVEMARRARRSSPPVSINF